MQKERARLGITGVVVHRKIASVFFTGKSADKLILRQHIFLPVKCNNRQILWPRWPSA